MGVNEIVSNPRSDRICRLIAACSAFGTVILAGYAAIYCWSDSIVPQFRLEPWQTALTGVLILALAIWQVWVGTALVRNSPRASRLGRRSVVFNAIIATLAVGVVGAVSHSVLMAVGSTFGAFASVWLGAIPQSSALIPVLLLVQWFCLAGMGESDMNSRKRWRGVALSCIAYSAVLGIWTFSPMLDRWRFFDDPTTTFFNIGVAVHILALVWIARGWPGDWALAGLIGFGCFIIGLLLINQQFSKEGVGPIDSSTSMKEIGSILKVGWTGLSYYLPPTAYILAAVSSIALFRLRSLPDSAETSVGTSRVDEDHVQSSPMDVKEVSALISAHCLAKPDAFEDHPWGETVFKIAPKGKIFCFCGIETPVITVKSTLDQQSALIQHPNIEVAAYVGRYGWITVHLRDEDTFDLAFDLIDKSYEMVAPKKRK